MTYVAPTSRIPTYEIGDLPALASSLAKDSAEMHRLVLHAQTQDELFGEEVYRMGTDIGGWPQDVKEDALATAVQAWSARDQAQKLRQATTMKGIRLTDVQMQLHDTYRDTRIRARMLTGNTILVHGQQYTGPDRYTKPLQSRTNVVGELDQLFTNSFSLHDARILRLYGTVGRVIKKHVQYDIPLLDSRTLEPAVELTVEE